MSQAQEEVQCPLTVLFRAISSCRAQLKSEDRKNLLSSHEAKQHAEKTLNTQFSFPGSVHSTAEKPNPDPPSKAGRREQQQQHLHLARAQDQGIRNSRRKQTVGHCPSACHRGSLEGGKKEEDFIEGGGVGVGAREEQGDAEGELPSSSCHPCATQCGRHVGTTSKAGG